MKRFRLALAMALLAAACGSSGGTVTELPAGEIGDVPGEGGCAGPATLSFVGTPAPLDPSGTTDVVVRYFAGDCPLPGRRVACTVPGGGKGAVDGAPAVTGEDGTATVRATTTSCVAGTFAVSCCDPDDPAVPCITTDVTLACDKDAVLVVTVRDYLGGHAKVEEADILLTRIAADGSGGCAEVDIEALPPAAASSHVDLPGVATFPETAGLHAEKQQSWRVVVLGSVSGGPALAWGCEEVSVKCCKQAVVEVGLDHDLSARMQEDWEVTVGVDLATGLPEAAASAVADIGALLAEPERALLALSCAAAEGGTLRDLCTLSFVDPVHPWTSEYAPVGKDLSKAIHKRAAALLASACPDGYDACGSAWWLAEDLPAGLRAARVNARWKFPHLASEGDGPFTGEEDFVAVTLPWPDPVAKQGPGEGPAADSTEASSLDVVVALDHAAVPVEVARVGLWTVNVKPHATPVAWGATVATAIEQGLLPHLYGAGGDKLPAVDSLSALVGAMLTGGRGCLKDGSCCFAFADSVTSGDPPDVSGLTKTALEGICGALMGELTAWLRGRLLAADPSPPSAQGLRMGSLDACTIADTTGDMVVDAFGSAAAPCSLDVTATLSGEPWTAAKASLRAVPLVP